MSQLPINEALSGIFGSISLTSWIFLIVPQLWENFRNQSTEALSIWFLMIWLLGDICNLIGAIWASLLPTVIGIGLYFCLIDSLMLGQVLYYNFYRPRKRILSNFAQDRQSEPDATDPLLGSTQEVRPPKNRPPQRRDSLSQVFSDETSYREVVRNTLSILIVVLVGFAGWFIAWMAGAWNPEDNLPDTTAPLGALILGYASSVFYLTARLPQIYTNIKRQSCSGLSILFFILSTLGNLTYGASILSHSLERAYLLKNTPWLLGSIGTLVQDFIIFGQFVYYGRRHRRVKPRRRSSGMLRD